MNTTTKQRKRRPSMAGVMSRLEEVERKQEENAKGFTKRMMDYESSLDEMRGRFNVVVEALFAAQNKGKR